MDSKQLHVMNAIVTKLEEEQAMVNAGYMGKMLFGSESDKEGG